VGRSGASKQGAGSGARHLLWGGRVLANRGRDRCQAPAAGRSDASKHGVWIWYQAPAAGRSDASKQGSRSGARHPLRGGRMLANRGLDLVPGTCCGAAGC
jgi:hypothetical protein